MYAKIYIVIIESLSCLFKLSLNRMMRNALYIMMGLGMAQVNAQIYYMSSSRHGQTFSTCSGYFYDDGGPSANYSNYINDRTITFCPSDPEMILRINFSSFHIEEGWDFFEVFYGDDATGFADEVYSGNEGAFVLEAQRPGECITFRFNSDLSITYAGWVAQISCFEPCAAPVAEFADDEEVQLCPADLSLSLDASASYSTDAHNITSYLWDWGDGTTTTTTTPIGTHTYDNVPGFYTVGLRVKTNNTSTHPTGCFSENVALRKVVIVPPPTFDGSSMASMNISCGDVISLTGVASSQTIVSSLPVGSGSSASLPDDTNTPFESTIDITGYFPPGATVTSACLPEVTLNLEHSYAGDLRILLIAPSGEFITLFNGYGDWNITNRKFGYCVKGTDNTGPGCVAPYHIVNNGTYNWSNNAGLTNFTQTCSVYAGPCEADYYYYRQNQRFSSAESMNNLNGAALNGVWTLRIIDYLGLDDGYLDSWSIKFPSTCYVQQEILTPILNDAVWATSDNGPGVPGTQNTTQEVYTTTGIDDCPAGMTCVGNRRTNTVEVGPFTSAGTFVYEYQVTDDLGCEHTYEVEVNVEPTTIEFLGLPTIYCENEVADTLPDVSSNNIPGVWSPAFIDTTVVGETLYTFTPDDANCAAPFELMITVEAAPGMTDINYD